MPRRAKLPLAAAMVCVSLAGPSLARATPPLPPVLPQDPAVYAEWICYPLRRAIAGPVGGAIDPGAAIEVGGCGCGFAGACGDRAPAGCYCDERCVAEGDCCDDVDLFCGRGELR